MGQEKSRIKTKTDQPEGFISPVYEIRGTSVKKPKKLTNSMLEKTNYFQNNGLPLSHKPDKNGSEQFKSRINDKMLLSTNTTAESKLVQIDKQSTQRMDNFFHDFGFEARYTVLEFLGDELHNLMLLNRKWRKAIKELLITAGTDTAKRFLSKNKEYVSSYSLSTRLLSTNKIKRTDLLINFKFNEILKNKEILIEYSYKLLNSAETNYCSFEFNIKDSLQNRFFVFYEHSRFNNKNSSLWSSVNHNYSIRSTISIPIILGSNDEFIDLRSVRWRKVRVGSIKPEILYENEITKNFKNFEWKEIKNEFLNQLLPTALLKNNFTILKQVYYGMDTVILKGEYLARKKGKIMMYDESDSKNSLKINIYDEKDHEKVANVMKPPDILKDVDETLNLCKNDVLVFYIKKNFDGY